nr:MAG TPA: hypothetical protein [Caudoviricetes sp.]
MTILFDYQEQITNFPYQQTNSLISLTLCCFRRPLCRLPMQSV